MNPWRGLRGLPREVWILFTATLVNRAGSMVLPFLVLYLTRELGFSAGLAGIVVLLYGAGALIAAPISGALSDLIGPIQVMRASLALSGAILFLFLLADDAPSVIAATFRRRRSQGRRRPPGSRHSAASGARRRARPRSSD